MPLHDSFQGREAELRSHGFGRWTSILFLVVWLSIWACGEAIVTWMLVKGAWALVTGTPPAPGRTVLPTGAALATGVFLLGWLAFWTLGGILAGRELLRLMFGRDRIRLKEHEVEIEWSYGLFTRRKTFPRDQVRRFYRDRRCAVRLEHAEGSLEVTRLGTEPERVSAIEALNDAWSLDSVPAGAAFLPRDWRAVTVPEGGTAIIGDPEMRRKLLIIVWCIFVPLAIVAVIFVPLTIRDRSLLVFALFIGGAALLLGWGAWRLTWTRDEWLLESGQLVHQRRRGGRVQRRFEGAHLELAEVRDDDGDLDYQLVAVRAGAASVVTIPQHNRDRKTIMRASNDPTEPRALGLWLAARTRLAFTDRTGPEAAARDLEALKAQLAQSGRLGRVLVALIGRFSPRK